MGGANEDYVSISRFKRKHEDFSLWRVRMIAIIGAKGLMGLVKGKEERPTGSNCEALEAAAIYDEKVWKARAILVSSLGDQPLRAVQGVHNVKHRLYKLLGMEIAGTTN